MQALSPFSRYDRLLLAVALLLVSFGTLMIYSTTSVVSPAKGLWEEGLSPFYYFRKHLFTVMLGLMMLVAAMRIRLSGLGRLSIPLLIASLVLLLLVFVPGIGVTAGKARRWIRLWPSTFQPSEFVKLSMVVFLAWYMSRPGFRPERFTHFALPIGVMLLFQGIFLLQPDFGATMILGFLTVGMLFVSGVRLRYLLSLLLLSAPVVIKLLSAPYRLRRITAFMDPWQDPKGSGFQLIQSFIALGSGGLTGVGLGNSKQKLSFLPEVHTDFIFSIVGEEMGFVAAFIVVFLFAALFIKGLLIAQKNGGEPFVFYLAFGLSLMLALQALVNFFVVTGLAPTKGLPLPFISYGGSALLMNMAAVGILLNISKGGNARSATARKDGLGEILRRKKLKRKIYGATA